MKIQPNPSKQDERVTNEGWTLRRGDNQGLMTRLTSTFGQHQNERDGPLLGSCQVMPFGNAKKSTTFSGVYTHENDPIRDVPYAQGFPHMSELLKYNVERPTGWTWHACNMAHVVAASNKVPTAASSGFSQGNNSKTIHDQFQAQQQQWLNQYTHNSIHKAGVPRSSSCLSSITTSKQTNSNSNIPTNSGNGFLASWSVDMDRNRL